MLTVYKYRIPICDYFNINLPVDSKIIDINEQLGEIYIWALVDPLNAYITRRFRLAGTGHPIDELVDNLEHIKTFSMENGRLIFHVFEIK